MQPGVEVDNAYTRPIENIVTTQRMACVYGATAGDVMSTEVISAKAEWNLEQLADFLIENEISGAPVVSKEDKLVGVVTISDIVKKGVSHYRDKDYKKSKQLFGDYSSEGLFTKAKKALENDSRTVADIMTPSVYEAHVGTDIKNVADAMLKLKVHRLFVTDGNQLVGIVSSMDILRFLVDLR